MASAVGFGIVSLIAGIGLCFFNQGMGVVAAISIIGAGIIYHQTKNS